MIPMAGKGKRTKTLGEFKPFIKIKGQVILGWLLLSIKRHIRPKDEIVFVTTRYFSKKFNVSGNIKKILRGHKIRNKSRILLTGNNLRGPAKTVYQALFLIDRTKPIAVVNCDQYVDFDFGGNVPQNTCFMTIYAEFTNKSGYVKIEKGLITKVIEKKNISNLASAGVFIFPSGEVLLNAIKQLFEEKLTVKGEYYISSAMNYLVPAGYKILPISVMAKYDLGTIKGIKHFSSIITQKTLYIPQ